MKRAIFIDRDNTIIHNDGDMGSPSDVRLIRGAAHAIGSLRQLGYRIIVVTNQGGVARGHYTEADVDAVHQRIVELVYEASGAVIDRFYYCPYHPDGTVEEYARDHPWRKPSPGMLLEAARSLDLDLEECWMIGDQERDVEAGLAAGTQTILISNEAAPQTRAHFNAATLAESAAIIAQNRSRTHDPLNSPEEPIVVSATATSPSAQQHTPAVLALETQAEDESVALVESEDSAAPQSQTQSRPATDEPTDDPPTVQMPDDQTTPRRVRRRRPRNRSRRPAPVGPLQTDTESVEDPSAAMERQLIEIHSEIRSWRQSQREFTPAIMLGTLGILAMIMISAAVAVYTDGPTALAWIGVTLVAQMGIIGFLVLSLRR